MQISFDAKDTCGVIRVAGDARVWNHPDRAAALLDTFEQIPDTCATLTLDLSGIDYIDSAGIGVLARLRFRCAASGLHLQALLPGGTAGQALRIVRIFEGYEVQARDAVA